MEILKQGKGTADHLLPLGDWFSLSLPQAARSSDCSPFDAEDDRGASAHRRHGCGRPGVRRRDEATFEPKDEED